MMRPPGCFELSASRAPASRLLAGVAFLPVSADRITARASHFSSRRSCSKISVAKNFVLLRAGCPSGFSSPAATSMGISCGSKPRNQAVCAASSRAGIIFQVRNSVCWAVIFIHERPPRACAGANGCGFDSRKSFVRRLRRKRLPPGSALGSW